jgi:hypothetical protein
MPIKVHVGPIDVGSKYLPRELPAATIRLPHSFPLSAPPQLSSAAANRPPRGLSGINPNCCGKPVKPLGKPIQFSVTGLNPN